MVQNIASRGLESTKQAQEPKTELEALKSILEQQKVQSSLLRKMNEKMDTFTSSKNNVSQQDMKNTMDKFSSSVDTMNESMSTMSENMDDLRRSISFNIPDLAKAIRFSR